MEEKREATCLSMDSQQQHAIKQEPVSMESSDHMSWVYPKYDVCGDNLFQLDGFRSEASSSLSETDSMSGRSTPSSESASSSNESVSPGSTPTGSESAFHQYRQPIAHHGVGSLPFSYPITNSFDYYNQYSLQAYYGLYNSMYQQHYGATYHSFPWMTTYGQNLALTPVTGLRGTDLNLNQHVPSDDSVPRKKVLPFSIEAILAKDPSPKHVPVSPTMNERVESQDAYWCHVCEEFCRDAFEANLHRQRHLLENAIPALQRDIFMKLGHVTRHERQCYMNHVRCGVCRKTVVISSFKRHIASHNGFPCRLCGKEFYLNSRLQEHIHIHTGERPYSCSECDRKFAKKSSLKQHMNYHTDSKDAQCEFCGKRFYRACALRVHIRNHTGDFPFKCELPGCPKAFPQKIQLQLHMSTHRRRGDI